MKLLLISCFVLLQLPLETSPAQHSAGFTFKGFQQTVTKLSFDAQPSSLEDGLLTKISDDLDRIHAQYTTKFGPNAEASEDILKNVGEPYARSMADDLSSLQDLPRGESRLAMLKDIEGDLACKAAISASFKLTPNGFPATVDVIVHIDQTPGHGTLAGLSVLANGSLQSTQQPARYIFSTVKGNFETKLPPGRFCIWVSGPKGILIQQIFDIGRNGDREEIPLSL